MDARVAADQASAKSTVSTSAFSTTASNELLLAFVATDYVSGTNTTVKSISGGGLTWSLVIRSNGQRGTAEIWRAFALSPLSNASVTAALSQSVSSSITVLSFTGVNTSGTNGSGAVGATKAASASSGAPAATLTTTQNSSWVFGVGNDWDNAIARAPAAGQSLVHQYLSPVGDTYWVQMQNSPTLLSGTNVSINDTAPTADRYNLAIAEILPAASGTQTWGISGTVSPSSLGSGVTVNLSEPSTATATTNSSGVYSFTGLTNGTYTVTPSKTGETFTPASQTITISGANATGINFAVQTWAITGNISPSNSGTGTLLTLSGSASATATADASGNFSFPGLLNGTYTVTPSKTGYTFSPTSQSVTISGTAPIPISFTAQAVPTYGISGNISPAASGSGTLLTLSGSPSAMTTADSTGAYTFTGLAAGSYTVTPSKTGFTFTPASQPVTITSQNVTGINFTVQAVTQTSQKYPDLRDVLPPSAFSITQSTSGKMLNYTHDTFNAGPGALVIQPAYNSASGTYQGTQYIYSLSSSGTWSLTGTQRIAGAFEFDSAHGHFHFPFASYGLYAVAANGGIGAPVAVSTKVGFCIADSFIYDPSLPNAGQLGNIGSCSDPTALRGLDIGAVDEYDKTDEGQSINIDSVPDGTYWLRAIDDPNNFFAEADKSNNETDVQIQISGNNVTVLQTVTPVLPTPPSIALTSPLDGATVSNTVLLTTSTGITSGVQYLVDGKLLGGLNLAPPFSVAWDTTTVPNGTHWLAAQTAGPTGVIGTSPVIAVSVANASANPPTVSVTAPSQGSTVSAVITVDATVASSVGISSTTFYVDGVAIGSPVTTPPYMTYWDTETVGAGQHAITASSTDVTGNVGTSSPVTVTVDNSHPPAVIGKDATVSIDGNNTMTTPAFSTTLDGDLLVAFVAYDGPATGQQTATVSGGGLSWTLMKRSNSQAGTAEIWAATAGAPLTNATVISQPAVSGYHGSMTVIAFTNASGPGIVAQAGAASGAPDVYVPGVHAGNWVFAVGNDWDNAISRTPVSGQLLVHQRVDTQVGDTFWVQSTVMPSAADALVDIHDNSPTTDRWNYAAVEIVATRP